KKAYARLPAPVGVHNLYGPTEAAVDVTYWPCPRGEDFHRVPIGRPVANTVLYVLDVHGQPAPVGIPGELHIGGVQVGRGYWQRPQLTAERFIPDAFSGIPGARLYRTGDVARWLADGTLEYLGRADFQVKLRGFRIELGEVEAALRAHLDVFDAVAVVREDAPGDQRLVAYVTGEPALDVAALRARLVEQLPAHMVPTAIETLPSLPLSPNGKVDRKALPQPRATPAPGAAAPLPVQERMTPFQQRVAALFRELLRVERVGLHDDFFSLGGHSLLATQLISRLRTTFGVELSLNALFDAPSVASVTELVEEGMLVRVTAPQIPVLRPVARDGSLPLSFAQQRLWLIDQLQPGGSQYNLPGAVRLEGALDTEALRRALESLVKRHEPLRTRFVMRDGDPLQVIDPASDWALPVTDLTGLPRGDRETEARRLAATDAGQPFDLSAGPLLRTLLLKLDADLHVLVLTMHHIVSDGWSLGVIVREVAAAYDAFAQGRGPALPPLPIQYADFASWQRQWLQGDVLTAHVDWWKEQLAGAPQVLDLPTDKARPNQRSQFGELYPIHLSQDVVAPFLALARQAGATPYMALLAVWQVLLSRYSRQEDLLVGSPIAGRRHGEVEGLVGFFVNTLVLRARVRPRDSFRAFLAQVRDTTLAAYEHQDLPFEKLVEELQPRRDLGRNPLVQTFFSLLNTPTGPMQATGLTLRPADVDIATSRFDLGLALMDDADGLRGAIEYSTDLFEPATVARLAGHLRVLVESVAATPDQPLFTLEMLTPGERHQLLREWNDSPARYDGAGGTIAEVIARHASLRPFAVALECGDETLTFEQLDTRANQLANLLRSRGVSTEVLVAVSLERGTAWVIAMLAVLKAGGAFVPLDASYPAQRLAIMLEDAPPHLLLASRANHAKLPLPDGGLPTLLLEELDLSEWPTTSPVSDVGPNHLAYVMFTSGSTGRPKGVAIPHRGVLRLSHSEPFIRFGVRETGLVMAPASFDGSVMELWLPLLNGSGVVLYPPEAQASDLDTLSRVVERHGVTLIHFPAGLFSQVVEHRSDLLKKLRAINVVGDILSAPHTRRTLTTTGVPVTNGYGPTENSIISTSYTAYEASQVGASVPIGRPVSNTQAYVLDSQLQLVPVGVPGELYVGGEGLGRGYVSRPDLTAERFIPAPFATQPGARLYRTGDLVRWRPDGTLEFIGRIDNQVKVRGFRIELADVEAALRTQPGVLEAAAVVREDIPGDKRLVAYAMGRDDAPLDVAALRAGMRQRLPEYMVPSVFVVLPTLPLSTSGKVDRKALPAPDSASTGRDGHFVEPSSPLAQQLAALWAKELGTERIGLHDHLFDDLGGTSLSVVRIAKRMRETLNREVPVVWLFEHPTVDALAAVLERDAKVDEVPAAPARPEPASEPSAEAKHATGSGLVAIVGMSGRFPGARSVQDFWRNLRDGVESISRFTPEQLERLPGLPEGLELSQHPAFVPAGGVLDGIDGFDPGFFDLSLREAQWMDPQQRLFLQTAWSALEDAGIDPERTPEAISLYAGAIDSGYKDAVRATLPLDGAALFELYGTATHESLATKASFKLGLTGESVLIYTACSTGLVAVHLACQNLLAGRSGVALAGATRIAVPQRTGYVYQEGMILSPDGHCRSFDANAQGTVSGNGVACVVLKRLEDAQRDGDSIYAVIRATATNNDGRYKSGYTAPSVQGQAAVISQALARSGVRAQDIGYVETHGTATPLGDPIEVAALQRAYGLGVEHRGTIALASLKSNMGHLDTVAGLAGLMKVALSLHHGEVPPSLHFERPNPQIDFDASPFFVNTTLRPWPRTETPRRAAVSSFGIGGTNAHAVLEESPMAHSGSTTRSHQVVTLSARSAEALEAAARQLAGHAEAHAADLSLADVAFTHAVGRKAFEFRRTVVARDAADLTARLRKPYTPVKVADADVNRRRVAFIFPGQGAQQAGMGRELYEAEPAFRAHADACLALLEPALRERVREVLFAGPGMDAAAVADTRAALPALFTVEYSLARMWMDWGLRPYAVLGHSFGEYAAACLSGVLSLEDAMRLAVARGELMHRMPPGAMLAVAMPESQVLPLLTGRLSLAAINAPDRCVVAGPIAEVDRLQEELRRSEVGTVRMPAPHAFHSADVEPLMPALAEVVASLQRQAPTLRYASSVTGRWAQANELAQPDYWAAQMRQPVRFTNAVGALLEEGCSLLLEVGPGQDLTPLVRACLGRDKERVKAVATLRRGGTTTEHASLMTAVGELWTLGVSVDWSVFYGHEQRLRLHLPTYPFQEKRCWVEAPARPAPVAMPSLANGAGHGSLAAPHATSPRQVQVQETPVPAATPEREDAPRGDIEERLASLWRERLGLPFVGRDDNFLEIGGNSLMAAQLLNQVRSTFGVQLPLAALFEAPTVAGIAQRIESLLRQAPVVESSRELPIVPLPRNEPLPLSFVQERVWRLEQHLPGLSAYNIPFVLRLEGAVDAVLLERAVQEIIQRHESLRTTYDVVDGRPVQRFHARMHIPLVRVDLTGAPEHREAEAMQLAREDAAKPFDLVKGPVVRTTLVRLDERLHILLGNIHHIVSDTLSISIFIHELFQCYAAFQQGRPSPLLPLPVQYADFGAWQRKVVAEGRLPDQESWWRQQLAAMPRQLGIATDRPRPPTSPLTSVRMPVSFSAALSREVAGFGKREGYTSYMMVLAAWQALLHRYSGQTDIIVGTPIGNRTRPELLPLIGYVAHSAAFRTSFADDPTFLELLARVRQEVNDVQLRPDVPFEHLVEALIPGKDIGRGRLTDTIVVFHTTAGGAAAALELTGVRGTMMEVPDAPVQWGATLSDLSLVLGDDSGRIGGALEYATELFDEATARRIVEHLQVLLGSALARPSERISRLPLATDADRSAWPAPLPRSVSTPVPTRLSQRAARQPGATAVLQGATSWTWSDLAQRARNVAARLRALGVQPGEPVAVCLKPSPTKLAVLWGVLEAGGAVVAVGSTDLGRLSDFALPGAQVPVLITWRGIMTAARLDAARVLHVEDALESSGALAERPAPAPEALAWLLPVGANQSPWALVHQGLTELFDALDMRLRPSEGATWVAAAESSAERPELEALWALSRGLTVTFPSEQVTAQWEVLQGGGPRQGAMDLSLIYFANDEDSLVGPKYELLIEGAKYADANGFSAVWTPERHFHSFGGLYPQPAVVAGALATITRNLSLRSGSVVLPLHDPLQVAEQWSVVDNLSGGRAGLSIATGWHVADFTFAPQNFEDRRNVLLRNLETVRALWRGEKLRRPGGGGVTVEVGLRPKPVQKELPVWLTAAGSPETFRLAGEVGAGVLTGLLTQSLEELKQKVALYREAWRRNGHPGRGHVALMLHAFIGDDEQEVLRTVRKPLLSYFRSSAEITATLLAAQGYQGEIDKVSEEDVNALLEHTFEHHAKGTGLIGTVESGVQRLLHVREADVDEVACLIDFGLDTPVVLEGLRRLTVIRERLVQDASQRKVQRQAEGTLAVDELLALARQSGAVLLHASARLARTLVELPQAREALEPVGALVLDGASAELALSLHRNLGTEVLLAGAAGEGGLLPRPPSERVPEGLQSWVLDAAGLPVPPGVVGELALEGAGLPWDLWRANEQERRRFVQHPSSSSARLFRTGRHARLRVDGRVEHVTLPAAPKVQAPVAAQKPKPKAPSVPALQPEHSAIPRVPRTRPLPLSFAQQRLWYLQQLDPSSTAYNNGSSFRLTGPLNVEALQAALNEVVQRHEVLRTTYQLTEEGAVQLIHAEGSLPMPVEDVPGETPEAREAEMLRRCAALGALPFDLDKGPVARAVLLRMGLEEHVLSLMQHHVISDAWCTLVLGRELSVLYACFSAGIPSPLPPLEVQYADYAVWQRQWLEGAVMEEQVRWWKERLTSVPALELPTDRPRPAVQSYAGGSFRFELPSDVSEPLLAFGRREGATSFMVLMALFQALLGRTAGQEDFAVGIPTAGRSRPEVEGLLGCFVNTLALRSRLEGAPSFRELLGRVKSQSLDAFAHQDAPFERIIEALQLPRDQSRTPVFQAVLNVVNTPTVDVAHQSLKLSQLGIEADTSKFDLSLEIVERKNTLFCRFEYASSLFDGGTVQRLAGHLIELARAVIVTPDLPLQRVAILSEDERRQVLKGFQGREMAPASEASIHALMEAQVARTPDAVAVAFESERLTYRELDAKANQVAHHLRGLGVAPESLVGVCLERSVDMVVALLGVLKAGAAYVPVDPAYPKERLGWMLEDTGASVLLTHEKWKTVLPPSAARVVCLDSAAGEVAKQPVTKPAVQVGPQALAYVIFTSGSTGRPKGAMNAHGGVVNRLKWMQEEYGLGGTDVVLQKTPFSFDVSVWEFFWPLLAGAKLV
ncbi:amino acid adenylation domain-containing protein/natural product biosynthesis luciferase-like monooxygenase domain-containing protein, partial [Myxococcus xanthus]